ncbi:MAG: ATP-binding protein [Nitrososphaerota archaeon]|nr:ATP-binding protein [Candidatus Bathyarchaeota archaeon]MCX8161633.1 ATP-binding protein [Candidatus Bathyarchaeota archaeon]MDW8061201.1 ATP-binding protein [Nitrososphaerota archaeon]
MFRCAVKIMVCGKGGTGKTVVSILLAKVLSEGYRVYIVDSDESNILLPRLLGVKPPKPLIDYIGGKRDEAELESRELDIASMLSRAESGVRLRVLPDEYISYSRDGVGLTVIGKVREYGEGCACPFNILTRILLRNLVLDNDEKVIVDTDAGIEHIGRGIEEAVDGIIALIDPTAESIEIAALLRDVSLSLGKRFWVLANKVDGRVKDILVEKAEEAGLRIDGFIRFDEEIIESCLLGEELRSDSALEDIKSIAYHLKLIE